MLASPLWRNIANGSFQNLQQSLLHTFTGHVAGDGHVLGLAGDLVDFVNVDDAHLGPTHIEIGRLEQAQDNILNILTDIAGLSDDGGIGDGKGDVEHLSQRFGQ